MHFLSTIVPTLLFAASLVSANPVGARTSSDLLSRDGNVARAIKCGSHTPKYITGTCRHFDTGSEQVPTCYATCSGIHTGGGFVSNLIKDY